MVVGLRLARRLRAAELEVIGDSDLLVKQMNGAYRVKNLQLQTLHAAAGKVAAGFKRCRFSHVLRHKNKRADQLANLAMDESSTAGPAFDSAKWVASLSELA